VDGGDVATETGLAAELRRASARRGCLPSATSGHGRRQWVAGVAVELLRWWRSSEDELWRAFRGGGYGGRGSGERGKRKYALTKAQLKQPTRQGGGGG